MVAKETGAGFIDLQLLTENLAVRLGPKNSEKLFLILQPGESKNFPQGITDNTHLNTYGAKQVASIVANELKRQNIPLSKYLLTDKKEE